MTPRVRWMPPTGLMAFGDNLDSSGASGPVTSAAKRWREACHCGRVDGVTKGRQRKCVNWGLGGIEGCRGYRDDGLLRTLCSQSSR